MNIAEFIISVDNFVWGLPLVIFSLGCGLLLCYGAQFGLLLLLLFHQCLDGVLIVLHLCPFFAAGAIEHAESYQYRTNQEESEECVFFHLFSDCVN